MATWHTPATLRQQWKACPAGDELAQELLDVAKEQVLAFGPKLADVAAPPTNYRLAQAMQARALWEAQHASTRATEDAVGGEYQVRVYPMGYNIQDIIRPQTGMPVVG